MQKCALLYGCVKIGGNDFFGSEPTAKVASHTDCNGATVDYSFDHADRLITTTYPDTSTVSLSWDSGNRLSSTVDSTGTTGYTMDAANRTTQIAAPNGTVGYGYDNADRRTSMTQGSLSWGYSYDAGNRLSSTTSPYSETTSNSWDSANRISTVTSGDSSVVYYSYDTANRPTEVKHKTSGGTVLTDYQYGYDAVNCTYQIDSDGTETDYGYDDSDQLTSEERDNSHDTGYTIAYTYDHNQNRLTNVLNSVTDYYSYDSANKLTGVTGSQTKSYGYDSNGNCTSIAVGSGMTPPTTYLSYDYENRVVGITYPSSATNSFSYNGNDLRIKKVDSSGTRNYITDGDSPAAPVLSDGLATFTPGLSERRSGTSAYYHGDALGSTRDITNSSQSVTDTRRYDAFGMSISPTGSNPTPFGFVGGSQYQTDADSGLMLLGHRYYDSSIGRFISKDPAQAGTNWYAYCRNRPLSLTDRSGLEEEEPGEVPLLGRPGSLGGMGGAGGGEGVGAVDEPVPEAVPVDGAVIAEAGGAGGAAGGDAGGSLGREVGGGGPELEPVKAGNKFPWHRPTPKNPYPRSDIREGRSAIGTYDGDGYLVGRTDRFSRSGRADHPMPHGQPARWEPNARNPAGNGQWGPHMIDEEEYLQLIIEALE